MASGAEQPSGLHIYDRIVAEFQDQIDGMTFEHAWAHRKQDSFGPATVCFISREDLIANKRAAGRSKDLIDVDQLEKAREKRTAGTKRASKPRTLHSPLTKTPAWSFKDLGGANLVKMRQRVILVLDGSEKGRYTKKCPRSLSGTAIKFFFFSNEGVPREPCHIHVRKGERLAKFWLDPEIQLASSWAMSSSELNDLERIVEEKANMIRRKWNEYFND